uniref:Uncharacterized protein n=1 Tax=Setaria digitata TaxID=48799 RepID=A0A915Q191_9BILA
MLKKIMYYLLINSCLFVVVVVVVIVVVVVVVVATAVATSTAPANAVSINVNSYDRDSVDSIDSTDCGNGDSDA